MRTRSSLAVTVGTVAVVGVMAGPAAAAGQVERGPEHARSICSFSGLNDEPDAEFPEGGRVQSFGQLVRNGVLVPSVIKSGEPSPGTLCNPNNLPLK